jgi:undecaprenyl-diphosphatase
MRDLSSLGGPIVTTLIVASVAGYLAIRRRWIQTTTVLAASIGGSVLTALIKLAYERPRPDLALHLMPATSPGFPSGHSMLSAVIYLTLGALVARVTPGTAGRIFVIGLAMLVTILVGGSRVYLGVHYPSDVLAGWAVGLVWALLCWMFARARLARAAARALHVPDDETGPEAG